MNLPKSLIEKRDAITHEEYNGTDSTYIDRHNFKNGTSYRILELEHELMELTKCPDNCASCKENIKDALSQTKEKK